MQQILHSQLNTPSSQTTGLKNLVQNKTNTEASGFHSTDGNTTSLKREIDNAVSFKLSSTTAPEGFEDSFKQIFQSLEPGKNTSDPIQADFLDWQKWLNQNPELAQQFQDNPEFLEQLQQMLEGGEGQGITTTMVYQGETLPLVRYGAADTGKGSDEVNSIVTIDIDKGAEPVSVNLTGNIGNDNLTGLNTVLQPNQAIMPQTLNRSHLGEPDLNQGNGTQNKVFLSGLHNVSAENLTVENLVHNKPVEGLQSSPLQQVQQSGYQVAGTQLPGVQPSETDTRFKMAFESLTQSGSESSDLLESAVNSVDRNETARNNFSELQSRMQGSGLRQYATSVDANVNDPDWSEQISQKIVWLSGRHIQSAEVHLNPADMGPIDVKINVQNDQAVVTFHAQNSSVRDMLESNVLRLREMMEANGVDLTEVTVDSGGADDQYAAQGNGGEENNSGNTPNPGSQMNSEREQGHEETHITGVSSQIVDFYA